MANELARKLRRTMTRQEVRLWLRLRQLRELGFHFRRQAPIKNYIVDFACHHPKVIVEIDGSRHATKQHELRDAARDKALVSDGFKIVRVWNSDVDGNLEGVFDKILHELMSSSPPTPASPEGDAVPPHEGEG